MQYTRAACEAQSEISRVDGGEIDVVLSLVPEKKPPVPSIYGVIEARFFETTC